MKKKTVGRKQVNISPAQVEKMAGYGLNNTQIADCLGCEDSTIGTKFRESVIKGRANLRMKLSKKQIDVALQGNVTMLIWLGKQYLNQRDNENENGLTETELTRLRNLAKSEMEGAM